ncbi:MAG: hypothetical protein M1483_07605 [Actinobacteria bacterium]|nr:hypothetical protein [Actinomycetota bacterium]MCL6105474.1 hypothetical protein [Actinomycetota bacterium]
MDKENNKNGIGNEDSAGNGNNGDPNKAQKRTRAPKRSIDTESLLNSLREHPEYIPTLRQILLTDKLIEMPGQFARMITALNKSLEQTPTLLQSIIKQMGSMINQMDKSSNVAEKMAISLTAVVAATDRMAAAIDHLIKWTQQTDQHLASLNHEVAALNRKQRDNFSDPNEF